MKVVAKVSLLTKSTRKIIINSELSLLEVGVSCNLLFASVSPVMYSIEQIHGSKTIWGGLTMEMVGGSLTEMKLRNSLLSVWILTRRMAILFEYPFDIIINE